MNERTYNVSNNVVSYAYIHDVKVKITWIRKYAILYIWC